VTAPIHIEVRVDQAERPCLIAGAEQLNESLTVASGEPSPIHLRFHDPSAPLAGQAETAIVIMSLLPELARLDDPWPVVEARWRDQAALLVEAGAPTVLLCTIFRRVVDRAARAVLIERIRRLNLLAIDLSHDFGATVVDVDRVFAHIGGRGAQCDYRLGGRIAAEVAGYAVAYSLLSVGLDEAIAVDIQEHAKVFLGELQQIDVLVNRRLNRPR
jgi:hypothetical protein